MDWMEQLRAFTPMDEAQEAQQRMIVEYARRHREDVLTRDNPVAHLTASAMIINEKRDRALMIYHNIFQNWSWTGGHADGDGDLIAVSRREAREETGIRDLQLWSEIPVSLDVIPVAAHYKKGAYVCAHLHLSVAYGFLADDRLPLRIKEDENSAVGWIPLCDLWEKTKKEPGMQAIYRGILCRMLGGKADTPCE